MPVATIDEFGARANSLEENREEIETDYQEAFGEDLSLAPQTPQGQIIGVQASRDTEIGEQIVRVATGHSIDHAVGVQLGAISALLDVERRQATHSVVVATLTGVPTVFIPSGSRAKTVPGGAEFATTRDVTLTVAGVQVEMVAVEAGPVEAPAGTLTEIVTPHSWLGDGHQPSSRGGRGGAAI